MPYLPCISRYISLHLRYPWSREPYYANSDDQTLLNDAIVSAVTGNRTCLGSTMPYP